jgi:hypothetical protein
MRANLMVSVAAVLVAAVVPQTATLAAPAPATAARAAVATSAVASSSAAPAIQADTPAGPHYSDALRNRLHRQMPVFVSQPRVVKSQGSYKVSAKVRLRPWRTAKANAKRQWDEYKVALDVSRESTEVRFVGLTDDSREKGLIFSVKRSPVTVRAAGTYEVSIPVSKEVGRSLAKQTLSQQRKRLRMTVEHHKDVLARGKGRDFVQVAQSDQTGSDSPPMGGVGSLANTSVTDDLYYYDWIAGSTGVPYESELSVQGVNCISPLQWSSSSTGQETFSFNFQIYTGGQKYSNDSATATSLGQEAVQALKSSAVSGAQDALGEGPELFTPEGAAMAAVGWAADFIGDLLKEIDQNSCGKEPTLITTSEVITGGGATPQMWGAQSSTTWQVDETGNASPAANGSFNWAGGLGSSFRSSGTVDTYPENTKAYYTDIESNALSSSLVPTGYGPAPAVYPPDSSVAGSASLTATWDGSNMVLNCDPGEWDLFNPWGDSMAMTPGALSPPNNNAYSTNQMYMAVAYNGTDAQGNQVLNEPFAGVEPVTAYSEETQAFTIQASALQGITVSEWQCSIGASIQVQNWQIPSSWPTTQLTNTPNGQWWNAPNLIVNAPYVAPAGSAG